MRAFQEEGRTVLASVTLMKGITGFKVTVPTIGIIGEGRGHVTAT